MHRVELVSAHPTQSPINWLVPDGLLRPNHAVLAESGLTGLVLVGDRAAALGPEQRHDLVPDQPFACGDGRVTLCWRPIPNLPGPMSPEPTSGERPEREAIRFHLAVAGETTTLEPGELILVGRHPACDVRLTNPEVSFLHCALVASQGGVEVVDLDSSNGTQVDGTRVHAATVYGRSVLSIGPMPAALGPDATSLGRWSRLPSAPMQRIYALLDRLAPSSAPVYIQGESGTGKEGIAQSLHTLSGREGRFVALNAALLTPELAASELFGHLKGAFTGASQDRAGAFALAHNGTLFLDEIGELRADVQAELLRVVEEHQVRPLGASEPTAVNVRLVTATHHDLAAEMRAGTFREDLFHRLWVLPLTLPPLRERCEDIDVLACDFLGRQRPRRRLSAAAREELWRYRWPGNIRELLNSLRRACVLTDEITLEPKHLQLAGVCDQPATLDAVVRQSVLATYAKHNDSVAATARELGIHRATVYRHLRQARNERMRLP